MVILYFILISVLCVIFYMYNIKNTFVYAAKPKAPSCNPPKQMFNGVCQSLPSRPKVDAALSKLNSGKKPTDSIKKLIDKGIIYQKGGSGRYFSRAMPGEDKPPKSIGGKPGAGKPGAGKPGAGKPGAGKPVGGKPVGGKPAGGKPVGGKPVGGKPAGGKPAGGKPGAGKPIGAKGSTLPSHNPLSDILDSKSSKFCSSAFSGYPGVQNCGGGRAKSASYVEDNATQNDSARTSFSTAGKDAIKAGYVAIGSKSAALDTSGISTYSKGCQSYLAGNGGCIDWGNSGTRSKALSIIKSEIDKAHAAGANAIRLDEMDVCETNNGGSNSCQSGLSTALRQISNYTASLGMGIIGNNSPTSQKVLIDAQNNGGATVVAAMLDSSKGDLKDALKEMQSAIGDVPIMTVIS